MKITGDNHTMVFGTKKSGKSNFVQWLLHQPRYSSHLMYDLAGEHEVLNRYNPTNIIGDKAEAEFSEVTQRMVLNPPREQRPAIYAIEEIQLVAPNSGSMSEAMAELTFRNRHYNVGVLGIAQRPASVKADLVELADNIIIFRVRGKNDKRRLNQEVEGLGDAAADLPKYHFIEVTPERDYYVRKPVPKMETTGEL